MSPVPDGASRSRALVRCAGRWRCSVYAEFALLQGDRASGVCLGAASSTERHRDIESRVQRIASGLSEVEVETLLTALCAVAEPVETRFLWHPQVHDPADDVVLEAAINGAADALVTSDRQDFGQAPARFGITLLSSREALRRLPT